jgi:hypothetical protein
MKKEAQIKRLLKELELNLDEIRTRAWSIQDQIDDIRKMCDTNLSEKEIKRQNFKADFKYYFPLIVLALIIFGPILI